MHYFTHSSHRGEEDVIACTEHAPSIQHSYPVSVCVRVGALRAYFVRLRKMYRRIGINNNWQTPLILPCNEMGPNETTRHMQTRYFSIYSNEGSNANSDEWLCPNDNKPPNRHMPIICWHLHVPMLCVIFPNASQFSNTYFRLHAGASASNANLQNFQCTCFSIECSQLMELICSAVYCTQSHTENNIALENVDKI